jgi:hypothetical protein
LSLKIGIIIEDWWFCFCTSIFSVSLIT